MIDPAPTAMVGGGGVALGYVLNQLRLWRLDRDTSTGAKRDRQEARIDKLFIEIGELRGEVRVLSDTNAELAADRAALKVELALVKEDRDMLRQKLTLRDVQEATQRRASDA